MNIIDIIVHKREGKKHTREQLHFLIQKITSRTAPDYQISAWLMAAYLKGLDAEETAWLTLEMADSGEKLNLISLPKPWVDKHSTGGVGDKTTLIVLPILAACGLTVLKMSGRGLGITGGTADKLESIQGLKSLLTSEEMIKQAKNIGIAWTSQSPTLAPADKEIYALRDATATVSSIPLITSSILSKKIAAGAEHVILDVKCGSGAFMQTYPEAQQLSQMMLETAKYANLNLKIMITDMSQPLGEAVGNALEIEESLKILKGELHNRLTQLCIEIASLTLYESQHISQIHEARSKVIEVLENGLAYKKLEEWFIAQGVDSNFFNHHWDYMPCASYKETVFHDQESGWVSQWDAHLVGTAVLELGGGRVQKSDQIDHSVGIRSFIEIGQKVVKGQPLYEIHASKLEDLQHAKQTLKKALQLSKEKIQTPKLVIEII